MSKVTKAHLAIAEANIDGLVAPDGITSRTWVLLLLAKVAAQGAEAEQTAVKSWLDDQGELELADGIEHGLHLEGVNG